MNQNQNLNKNNVSRAKYNQADEKMAGKSLRGIEDRNSVGKAEVNPKKQNENTLVLLNNCAKVIMEDFKSNMIILCDLDLTGAWVDHYNQYDENLKKTVHNILKFSGKIFINLKRNIRRKSKE